MPDSDPVISAQHGAGSVGRVIDVTLSRWHAFHPADAPVAGFVLAILVAAGVIVAVGSALGRRSPFLLIALAVLLFGGLLVLVVRYNRRSRRRTVGELAQALRSESPPEALAVLYRRHRAGSDNWSELLRQTLFQLRTRGYGGAAFRLAPPGPVFDVTPVLAPIEARVVRDSDVAFNELREALDTPRAKWTMSHWSRRYVQPWLAMILYNWWLLTMPLRSERYGTICLTVGIGVFVVIWTFRQLHIAWRGPTGPAGQIRFVTSKAPDDATWLLVNGGILLRWPDGETWLGRLLPRDEHILFMYPLDKAGTHWKMVVFISPQEQYSRELSSSECEVMLRAWRSPHPPPTGEVLGAV